MAWGGGGGSGRPAAWALCWASSARSWAARAAAVSRSTLAASLRARLEELGRAGAALPFGPLAGPFFAAELRARLALRRAVRRGRPAAAGETACVCPWRSARPPAGSCGGGGRGGSRGGRRPADAARRCAGARRLGRGGCGARRRAPEPGAGRRRLGRRGSSDFFCLRRSAREGLLCFGGFGGFGAFGCFWPSEVGAGRRSSPSLSASVLAPALDADHEQEQQNRNHQARHEVLDVVADEIADVAGEGCRDHRLDAT